MERHDVERALRAGATTSARWSPDGDGIEQDAKLLAVRVESFATELTPQDTILDEEPFGFAGTLGPLATGFDSRFLALPERLTFRPARTTPKPGLQGVQAAVVTAEEYPEDDRPAINADSQGRVRVRFPWDQRDDKNDKSPSSSRIRVSQYWAGTSYGALYSPRVGHEVPARRSRPADGTTSASRPATRWRSATSATGSTRARHSTSRRAAASSRWAAA